MPSKGHRAASKQAKLRHKRRHGRGGAQQFDAGPTESETVAVKPVREAETEVDAESEPQLTPKASGRRPPAASASPTRKAADDRRSDSAPIPVSGD